MIENIVTKYREAIDEWNSLIAANDDVPNMDEIFNIESSLKKIHIFYSSHDLGKYFSPTFNKVWTLIKIKWIQLQVSTKATVECSTPRSSQASVPLSRHTNRLFI